MPAIEEEDTVFYDFNTEGFYGDLMGQLEEQRSLLMSVWQRNECGLALQSSLLRIVQPNVEIRNTLSSSSNTNNEEVIQPKKGMMINLHLKSSEKNNHTIPDKVVSHKPFCLSPIRKKPGCTTLGDKSVKDEKLLGDSELKSTLKTTSSRRSLETTIKADQSKLMAKRIKALRSGNVDAYVSLVATEKSLEKSYQSQSNSAITGSPPRPAVIKNKNTLSPGNSVGSDVTETRKSTLNDAELMFAETQAKLKSMMSKHIMS